MLVFHLTMPHMQSMLVDHLMECLKIETLQSVEEKQCLDLLTNLCWQDIRVQLDVMKVPRIYHRVQTYAALQGVYLPLLHPYSFY